MLLALMVPSHLRVSLPQGLAEELIDDRLAVRPIATRGGPLAETLAMGIGSLEVAAAVVTIALEAPSIRRITAAALRPREGSEGDRVTLSITRSGETRTLVVDRADPEAEERAFEFFLAGFEAGS
jgi:hypothetical protein